MVWRLDVEDFRFWSIKLVSCAPCHVAVASMSSGSVDDGVNKSRFDSNQLSEEWDACPNIRDKLRNQKPLIGLSDHDVKIPKCVANADLISPVLLQVGAGTRLPEIEQLRECVSTLFSLNQITATEDVIDDASWDIRKMLRFVKMKAQRREVSTALWIKLQ